MQHSGNRESRPTAGNGFVRLGTPGDAEQLLLNEEYLRHEVFATTVREGDVEEWSWNVTEGYELAVAWGKEPIMFEPTDLGITAEHILDRYPMLDIRHALAESDMAKPVLPNSSHVGGDIG